MLKISLLTDEDLSELRRLHPIAGAWLEDRCLRRETRLLASQRILTTDEYRRLQMLSGAYPEEAKACKHIIWIRNGAAAKA